jgi:hypothetical protein
MCSASQLSLEKSDTEEPPPPKAIPAESGEALDTRTSTAPWVSPAEFWSRPVAVSAPPSTLGRRMSSR